jgi:hypothetical protein
VEIEARNDRNAVADQGTDAAQQLALAVFEMRRDHRTVEVEIDTVERPRAVAPCAGKVFEHAAHDPLVSVFVDIGRRRCRAPRQRRQLVAKSPQGLDRAGDRDVVAGNRVEQLRSADIAGPGVGAREIIPGRALRREGVGLVLEPADRDARHQSFLNSPPPASAAGGYSRWSSRTLRRPRYP